MQAAERAEVIERYFCGTSRSCQGNQLTILPRDDVNQSRLATADAFICAASLADIWQRTSRNHVVLLLAKCRWTSRHVQQHGTGVHSWVRLSLEACWRAALTTCSTWHHALKITSRLYAVQSSHKVQDRHKLIQLYPVPLLPLLGRLLPLTLLLQLSFGAAHYDHLQSLLSIPAAQCRHDPSAGPKAVVTC
jgi:hypothetical protein